MSEIASKTPPRSTGSSNGRARTVASTIIVQCVIAVVTLAGCEAILRAINFSYVRNYTWDMLVTGFDPELGWAPVPRAVKTIFGRRDQTIRNNVGIPGIDFGPDWRALNLRNNSIGLRDIEFERGSRPTILFLGDSMVWGYNVQEDERFTDLLREEMKGFNIVNAGVSGYGTDQEYLFLKRIWDRIRPDVVVLVFCVETDREDNSTNLRYNSYKPYLVQTETGAWQFRGEPTPPPRNYYFVSNWFARNLALARLAASVYFEVRAQVDGRYRKVNNPDPTERLVAMIREFAEARNARFLVGVDKTEPKLEAFLQGSGIPYTNLEGAERFTFTIHWSPTGHQFVAERFKALLSGTGVSDR